MGMLNRLRNAHDQTIGKIPETTYTMKATGQEIASLVAPLNLVDTRIRLRGQRPERENISDPVTNAMAQQKESLQKNKDALENTHNNEQQALRTLEHKKAELAADIQDKTKALYIDLECQKKNTTGFSHHQSPAATKKFMSQTLSSMGATYPMGSKRGSF